MVSGRGSFPRRKTSYQANSWLEIEHRIPGDCENSHNGEIQTSGDIVDRSRIASRMAPFQPTSTTHSWRPVAQERRERARELPEEHSNWSLQVHKAALRRKVCPGNLPKNHGPDDWRPGWCWGHNGWRNRRGRWSNTWWTIAVISGKSIKKGLKTKQ